MTPRYDHAAVAPRPMPRLLMLTHRVPLPADRGDRIRTSRILERLSRHFEVHLAALSDEHVTFETWSAIRRRVRQFVFDPVEPGDRLRRAGVALATGRSITEGVHRSRRLARTLRDWDRRYRFDAALAVCSSTAGYLLDMPIRTRVADLIDVDSAKWSAYERDGGATTRWLYRREARKVAALERRIASTLDAVTVATEPEAELARDVCGPRTAVTVAPNGVDTEHFRPSGGDRNEPSLVFTGVLNYRPNVDSLVWFARNVWPAVRTYRPDARLRIVGRDPSPAVRKLGLLAGVDLIGPVADVRPHLDGAAAAIAPLRIARGVQNKVLESMAMALPVIASPGAALGIDAHDGRDLLVADDPAEWIAALRSLLDEPNRAAAIGRAARQRVIDHHDWQVCLTPLVDLLLPAWAREDAAAAHDAPPIVTPHHGAADVRLRAA